jgi:hypothetical protein
MNKKKSKSIKLRGELDMEVTKEVGIFDDFLIIDKKNNKKQNELKELKIIEKFTIKDTKSKDKTSKDNDKEHKILQDWVFIDYINITIKPGDPNQSKSRFSDLFKKLEEEEKIKPQKTYDDIFKHKDIFDNSSSMVNQTKSTNFDSNIIEISNESKLKEKKKLKNSLQKEKTEVKNENMELDINNVIALKDNRTTLMIKNIPNKFNKDLLLNIIDQNFKGTYDLFILPTDANKCKNFGYAFINFTNSYYIPYFYFMLNGKMWSSTNSKKVCELTYSKVQGKDNLLSHYPSKIIYANVGAFNVTKDQKFIIPNVYKLIFNKLFPKQKIEEFKFYFLTTIPITN